MVDLPFSRELWIALRRSPRDALARKNLIRLLLGRGLVFVLGGCLLAWLGFKIWAIYDFNLIGLAVVVGIYLAFLVPLAISFLFGSVANGAASFIEFVRLRAIDRKSPAVPLEVKRILFREACLLATMLERCESEVALEKVWPAGVEIITRRVLLDRLRMLGLREGLDPGFRDLLFAPDGHWTAEQKARARHAWECFAVLNWVLGLGELRGLTIHPKYDLSDVRALFAIDQPEKLLVLEPHTLRMPRNQAVRFFNRCWYEMLARDAVRDASGEEMERAIQEKIEIEEEGYTGDYVVGTRTISELSTPFLWFLTRRAYNRFQLLDLLIAITSGKASAEGLRPFLSRYFAPPTGMEAGAG